MSDDGPVEKMLQPAVKHILQYFSCVHPPAHLRFIHTACVVLAEEMVSRLPQNPELTIGLRKLLEAEDCFMRAACTDME